MKFPSYVPNTVRQYISARLYGDHIESRGCVSVLEEAKTEVRRLEQELNEYLQVEQRLKAQFPESKSSSKVNDAFFDQLRIKIRQAKEFRDELVDQIALLERLGGDSRMLRVYALLDGALESDAQKTGFISAAYVADADYSRYRTKLKAAAKHAHLIAEKASELKALLHEAESSGYCPPEFFSIPALLEKTEHDENDRNYSLWRSMRRVILGHPQTDTIQNVSQPEITVQFVRPDQGGSPLDPAVAARNHARYMWEQSPDVGQMVGALQRAAEQFEPSLSGLTSEATMSRKSNRKSEFLRAFVTLLRNEHQIELTPDIMNAMALTANVVLELSDSDLASYDDVRKAVR